MQKRVLVVGSANMDFVMNVRTLPNKSETIIERRNYEYIPGGKGANSALTLARLGADSIFCANLGADVHGQKLLELYRENGIDTRFIKTDKRFSTGLAAIMVEDNGDNRIVVYPGANRGLSPADVEDAMTCIPDAVLLQFEIPEEAVIAATKFAKMRNIPVFVDTGAVRKGSNIEELAPLEILSPNEMETFALTGVMPTNFDNCLKAATLLMQRVETKYVVIKLGERGAYIHDGRYSQFVSPYEVEAVDTTGAGDAFTAAMTLKYIEHHDIEKAVKYANAVGAIVVSKTGASSSLPTNSEVERFIEEREN